MKRYELVLLNVVMVLMFLTGCGGSGDGSSSPSTGGTGTDTTAPSTPTGLVAASASSSAISLSWNASTDDVTVTGYKIYRGGTQISTSIANAFSDSGLTTSTTYTYTVAAYDAAGNNSAQSASASATTLAPGQTDTQAPTAPVNLTASAVSTTQINLAWTSSTDDVAVAGYEVWQGTTKIATVTTTSYSNTGLTASTTYTYTVKAFDGAGHISAASNTASATTSAASAPGTLLVKVKSNGDSTGLPNATVVLGDSNGVMLASKTTDSNGEATFSNPPANATVTAAAIMSCGTYTDQDIDVEYDVNRSTITSSLWLCSGGTSSFSNINLNITNIPAGAAGYTYSYGNMYSRTSLSSSNDFTQQLHIDANDLQSDGKISIAVVILDSGQQPMSYGLLTDLTVVSGMTATIAVNQAFTNSVQYQFNNIPSSAKNVRPSIWEERKSTFIGFGYELSTTGTSTTVVMPYIPSFADNYNFGAWLSMDQNNNGTADSSIGVWKWGSTTPADQTFDLSQVPTVPSNLAITGNDTATPTLVWTGNDSSAYMLSGYTYWPTGGSWIDVDFSASPERTSLPFPQLPDSLAAFRPNGLTQFTIYLDRSDMFTSYSDYETKIEQYENGTLTWPTSGTSSSSSAWYSSTQNLAPALNKTAAPSTKAKWTKQFGMPR